MADRYTPPHLAIAANARNPRGRVAMSVWRHARSTKDVDLLLGVAESQAEELFQRLKAAGLQPKNDPPFISLGEMKILQMLYEPPDAFLGMQIDLLLADTAYQKQAIDRRISVVLPRTDLQISVLTCEDLILHKLLAGRIIDRADASALLSLNSDTLDRRYLAHWLDALDLQADFLAIWQEVFPDRQFE
jgi:hypothetical protein